MAARNEQTVGEDGPEADDRVCYHEAAHAVLAHLLGKTVTSIRIHTPQQTMKDFRGQTHHTWHDGLVGAFGSPEEHARSLAAHAEDDWCVLVASSAGERILARLRGWQGYGPTHHASDYLNSLMLMRRQLSDEAYSEYLANLDAAEDRAEQMLSQDAHWRAVEAIAQALLHNYAGGTWMPLDDPLRPPDIVGLPVAGMSGEWAARLINQALTE